MGKCDVRRCHYDDCFEMSICNEKQHILSWLAIISNSNLTVKGNYKVYNIFNLFYILAARDQTNPSNWDDIFHEQRAINDKVSNCINNIHMIHLSDVMPMVFKILKACQTESTLQKT